jgi:hypothetical protein
VKDYILAKKYTYAQITLYPLDTALVLNTAASAVQAKKEDEAVVYYRKLTDANVSGKDYLEIYEYLVDYYNRKEDQANLQAMLAKAKSYYPENEFWYDVEIRNAKKSGDQALLLAKYEELLKQNPKNFTLSYNYGIELYNGLYGKEAKTGDNTEAKQKLTGVLQQAIDNEPNGDVTATVMMANHLFNVAADELNTSSMIKSTKPEDVKKKADMKAQAAKWKAIAADEEYKKELLSLQNKMFKTEANRKAAKEAETKATQAAEAAVKAATHATFMENKAKEAETKAAPALALLTRAATNAEQQRRKVCFCESPEFCFGRICNAPFSDEYYPENLLKRAGSKFYGVLTFDYIYYPRT